MNEKLRIYLEKCKPVAVEQATLDDLRRAMEEAVPEITESIRQREALAAQLRISSWTSSESNTDKQD